MTFRRDEALDLWVPDKMEEYYKAYSALDDILATATYTNVRRILKSDLEPNNGSRGSRGSKVPRVWFGWVPIRFSR